jgi:hypothetical protein
MIFVSPFFILPSAFPELRPSPGKGETQPVKLQRTGYRDKNRLRGVGAVEVRHYCPIRQRQIRAAQHDTI